MASKTRRALDKIIDDKLAPFKNLDGPEKLTVVNFIGNYGEAMSAKKGSVFITGKANLSPGMNVVGAPIGGKLYYVLGVI